MEVIEAASCQIRRTVNAMVRIRNVKHGQRVRKTSNIGFSSLNFSPFSKCACIDAFWSKQIRKDSHEYTCLKPLESTVINSRFNSELMNDAQDGNSFCVTLPKEIHCELTDQSAPELRKFLSSFKNQKYMQLALDSNSLHASYRCMSAWRVLDFHGGMKYIYIILVS
jgi:hypothetical protein